MNHQRVANVIAAMRAQSLGALIVTEPSNRLYLTGWQTPDPQPGENAYWLIVDADGPTVLAFTNDEAEARERVPGARIVVVPGRAALPESTAAALNVAGYERVGYDDDYLPAGAYLRLRDATSASTELTGFGELIRRVRAVKEPEEIELLRQAIRLTDEAYAALLEWLRPGVTEREIAWFVERHARDHGAGGVGFPVLVASGPGTAMIHHEPTDRPVREHELCWIDFGATVEGYSADLSRAFCLGTPDDRTQRIYHAIINSLDAGIAASVAGASSPDITAAYLAPLDPLGFPIGHVGGHGIGLQVHELPRVGPKSTDTLAENMVVTADPGIYISGWGGLRVEDDILITANGPEILSKAPRRLVV